MVGIQIQGKDSARTIDGVLLTTADRQIEAILGKSNLAESFSDSLYQSIVFYDGVVVPDILAFISTELNRSSGGQNVLDFSAALREGAITPAFRADAKTFTEALDIARQQKIKGIHQNADALAERLDKVRESKNAKPQREWNRSASESYAARILSALHRITATDEHGKRVMTNLAITADFIARNNLIGAVENSIDKKAGELLRGDLFQIVLDRLNMIQDSGNSSFEDSSSLLMHPALQSVSVEAAVKSLVIVGNLVYHENMASSVGAQNYLPRHMYVPSHIGAIDAAHQTTASNAEPTSPHGTEETVEFTVQIPTLAQLQAVGLSKLLDIRRKHEEGYFSYLKTWRAGKVTSLAVKEALEDYCHNIRLDVKAEATLAKVLLRKRSATEKFGLRAIRSIGNDLLKLTEDPLLGTAMNALTLYVGPAISMVYSWQSRTAIVPHKRLMDAVV